MKFLGCLLGFFLAVFIYLFVAARGVLTTVYRLWRGVRQAQKTADNPGKPGTGTTRKPQNQPAEGHFAKEGRTYVEFEEIKGE
ncbi:MAG: hypothetical protein J6M53_07355 [Bacteroidaceae bacterium]|nr:hypothetical protein [Bacteroidaceae bacterium]